MASPSPRWKLSLDDWKNFAQIAAVVGAGLFFGIKLLDGWLSADMAVSISTARKPDPADKTRDLLGITVHLNKGDRSSLAVHTAELRTTIGLGQGNSAVSPLPQARRLKQDRGRLDWSGYDDRPYNISAGETTQLGSVVSVPADSVVLVEFALVGESKSLLTQWAQWRASAVSLPDRSSSRDPAPTDGEGPAAVP